MTILAHPPALEVILYEGGIALALHNLAVVILIPYVVLFLIALGELFLPETPVELQDQASRGDVLIAKFFSGAGLAILVGFLLGVLNLLYPLLTGAIFLIALYSYFLRKPHIIPNSALVLLDWIFARPSPNPHQNGGQADHAWIPAIARASFAAILVFLVVVKSTYLEFENSDVVQLYLPYLSEVRRQHGIWLDPAHPIYADFLAGRGNGLHLLVTNFAGPYFSQGVSVAYALVMTSIVLRAATELFAVSGKHLNVTLWRQAAPAAITTASVVELFAFNVSFSKYHFQAMTLILGFLYLSLVMSTKTDGSQRWFYYSLIPLAIAVPISLPQNQLFIALAVLVAVMVHLLQFRSQRQPSVVYWTFVRLLLGLFSVGFLVCGLSLLFNWIYIGAPELNPYWTFARFIDPVTFSKWASHEALIYTSYIQRIHSLLPHESFSQVVPGLTSFFSSGESVGSALRPAIWTTAFLFLVNFQPKTAVVNPKLWLVGCFVTAAMVYDSLLTTPPEWISTLTPLMLVLACAATIMIGRTVRTNTRSFCPGGMGKILPASALGFLVYFLIVNGLDLLLGYPSLQRFSGYFVLLAPVSFMVTALAVSRSLSLLRLWISGAHAGPRWQIAISFAAAILLLVSLTGIVWSMTAYLSSAQQKAYTGASALIGVAALVYSVIAAANPVSGNLAHLLQRWSLSLLLTFIIIGPGLVQREIGIRYKFSPLPFILGWEGRVASITNESWDFSVCLELRQAVPDERKVLHLNAYHLMSQCLFSPLLPRDKLVHQYQSEFARQFGPIVFGTPDQAATELKKLGINYFLVYKGDTWFWGAGLSELFDTDNLMSRFGIFYESERFVVLTWRGSASRPIAPALVRTIDAWRETIRSRAGKPLTPEYPFDFWGAYLKMKGERARAGS